MRTNKELSTKDYTIFSGMIRTILSGTILIPLISLVLFLSGCKKDQATTHTLFINEVCAENLFVKKSYYFRKGYDYFSEQEDDWAYKAGKWRSERGNDWVEIYNPGTTAIEMGGMYFTDDLDKPKKWKIPKQNIILTRILPDERILFWFDKQLEHGANHVDFKLSGTGESLALFDTDGKTLIDMVSFGLQYDDVSYGRKEDGGEEWGYFMSPSPEDPNTEYTLKVLDKIPSFSESGGFYDKGFQLSIGGGSDAIYYSIDGTEPRAGAAKLYDGSFRLDTTTVVRACFIRDGHLPGPIFTQTFFIRERSDLPVVSISIDPRSLWDEDFGIYEYDNRWEDWERYGWVEYFDENKELVFSEGVATKLAGSYSRRSPKRSFSIVPKKKYGSESFEGVLFKDKPHLNSFEGLTLRADAMFGIGSGNSDSGSERWLTGERVKNELIYKLNDQMGNNVDMQAYQPVVLYINGFYWGLFNLMEKKEDDFIKNNHGVAKIDLIDPFKQKVWQGDMNHYFSLFDYIDEHDMNDPYVWGRVQSMIDIDNFIDILVLETWMSKGDMNHNCRMWRPKTSDGKWRFISFDQDHWKDPDHNTIERVMEADEMTKNFVFDMMMTGNTFKHRFINRMADCLNSVFLPGNINSLLEEITPIVASEKQRDRLRWADEMNYVEPGMQIAWIRNFVRERPTLLRDYFAQQFGLPGSKKLVLKADSEKGSIKINSLSIQNFPWTGLYFAGVPVEITAIPKDGYEFAGWSDSNLGTSANVIVDFRKDMQLTANFK